MRTLISIPSTVAFILILLIQAAFCDEPLIMEHANKFRGMGNSGSYFLEGGIRFKRGDARFYTESATWDSKKDELYCNGGFRFKHPKGKMVAESGYYKKAEDRVHAQGKIVAEDSASSVFLYGEQLDYFQKKQLTRVVGTPKLRRIITGADDSKDTLDITATYFEFNDSLQIAKAMANVVVVRGDMLIKCDTAIYDIKEGVLSLNGNPWAQIKQFEIKGKKMRVTMDQDTIQTMEVISEAQGTKSEKTKNGAIEISELTGDSLLVVFDDQNISNLEVVGKAESKNYRTDRTEFVNEMKGNSLKMIMNDGNLDTIKIWKQASTLYHYFNEKGGYEGKNDAVGDTIWLEFKNRQIDGFTLKGNVSQGVYSGEKKDVKE